MMPSCCAADQSNTLQVHAAAEWHKESFTAICTGHHALKAWGLLWKRKRRFKRVITSDLVVTMLLMVEVYLMRLTKRSEDIRIIPSAEGSNKKGELDRDFQKGHGFDG